jgi:hypothetical protein
MAFITVGKLPSGSVMLRAVHQKDRDLKYPPYFSHTVLGPIGNHGAELQGLADSENLRKLLKLALSAAADLGYWYVMIKRIRNDSEYFTIYWLTKEHL